MDIPLGAPVQCLDGMCGRSTHVVLRPETRRISHVVIAEKGLFGAERLVPIEHLADTTSNSIRLNLTKAQLAALDSFVEGEIVETAFEYAPFEAYAFGSGMPVVLERECVPEGEQAIRRGAEVRAADGAMGRVDDFLVDPKDERLTHLVLREGRLWGRRELAVPVSEIERIEEDVIYLKSSKKMIERCHAV